MMDEPEISVVLAVFNGKKYLKEQLDSILPQLSGSDELLILDDGSQDGSRELISAYAEKWTQIRLYTEGHCGVVQNFARGIQKARGKYIFLADQDDIWEADKAAKVCAALKSETGPALVLHNAAFVDEKGNLLANTLFSWRKAAPGFWKNWMKNSYMGCCMAFNQALKPYILPFPKRLPMHDQWIGLIAEHYGRVHLLQDALLRYRRHEETVTADHHAGMKVMIQWRLLLLAAYIKRIMRR